MANFCAKCGAPLEEGANFCTECGTPVLKPEAAPAQNTEATAENTEAAAANTGTPGEAPARAGEDNASVTPGAGLNAEQMRRFIPALAVFVILLIIICVSGARGYRKPIKLFEKGVNKKSAGILEKAVFDETMNAEQWQWFLEDQLGKDAGFDSVKVKIKIDGKEKMDEDSFRTQFGYMDSGYLNEMEKPRHVDTKSTWTMEYNNKRLKFDVDMDFIVVKYKGDWKIIGLDLSDMYEGMVNALNSM